MHYCFVTYGRLQKNPAYNRAYFLGKAILDRGIEVTYVLDDYLENHEFHVIDSRARIEYVPTPRSIRQFVKRRKLLTRVSPDFVHLLNPTLKNCLAVAGKQQYRVIVDWDEPPRFKPMRSARRKVVMALDRLMRRRADAITVCTHYLKDLFEREYGLDVLYLPHATYFSAAAAGPTPFTEPTFVYLGNLNPRWDHDLIIETAEHLARIGHRPPIQIIGGGPELQKLRKLVHDRDLHNVSLTGYLPDEELRNRLRHAHALLFPIRDTVYNRTRCPSKTFAYAQARRPIITNRVGEVAILLGNSATYIDCTPRGFADSILACRNRANLPDCDYGIERHNYGARADQLLRTIHQRWPDVAANPSRAA